MQPTDERRRTGSHYTPRTLTEPIVRHALEPAFERLGPDAKPEDVLALKVCDPAMGSGAFLVEACRQLAARLVRAWTRWPETRPRIPNDDEELHAKRLVAQRCLYGVDKNPRAVELAKLSLWLATLAREHEFTFLDHALKCGDSLVGLDAMQIAAMHWNTSKPGLPLFRKFVADRVAEATKARAEIQSAPDDTRRVVLEQKHKQVEKSVELVRVLGDAVISAFLAEDKPRAREKRRATIESWVTGIGEAKWDDLSAAAASLRAGAHPVRPFHWAIEFPEVFAGENAGFDAIVGNPPFAGKNTIIGGNRAHYLPWLQALHEGAHGNADLVAHFYRRAFTLLRKGGCFGLIATNTISQGNTRETGLAVILSKGGVISRVIRRLKWPGAAGVTVSLVHVVRESKLSYVTIDGRQYLRVSALLVPGHIDVAPQPLASNRNRAFKGLELGSMGFAFDPNAESGASPISAMEKLLTDGPQSSQVIRPMIGGGELNDSPTGIPVRYAIDLFGLSESEAWRRYPAVMRHLQHTLPAVRHAKSDQILPKNWWLYRRSGESMRTASRALASVLCVSEISKHIAFAYVSTKWIPLKTLVVLCADRIGMFTCVQSRPHLLWATLFGSTFEDRPIYVSSDCFETFPFPESFDTSPALEAAGQAYYDHRAALMIARIEGMTKTYNRFHDPDERGEDIVRLRELHADMDRAVLRAYGWGDLAERAEPIFLDETKEDDHTYQGRLFWPSAFRDEVLARLLALNAERAAAEHAAGFAPTASPAEGDDAGEGEGEEAA